MMPKHTITTRVLQAVAAIAIFFLFGYGEAAAKPADGTYEVEYTVKKPDSESVSIANDYFEKPARVEVRDGESVVYFQTNHNKWITSLKYPAGADGVELQAVEANEEEDTKVFRLPHANVLEPAALIVHVTIDELGYDQEYTIRLVFKTDQLPLLDEPAPSEKPGKTAAGVGEAASGGATPAPQPGTPPPAKPDGAEQQGDPAAAGSEQQGQAQQPDKPPVTEPEPQEPEASGSDASASPENAIPLATGSDAGTPVAVEPAENHPQKAASQPTDNPQTGAEASGSSAWPTIMLAVLAGCAVAAAGGLAYRRRNKRKSQTHESHPH